MKVSVVIPTFNRKVSLPAAIDSVLEQRGLPEGCELQVIVVDDASTDGTIELLAEAYAGRPVQLLRNSGAKGPAGGRNTGLEAAKDSDVVAFLDSDDRYLPHHLADALRVFAAHPRVGVVFGRARYLKDGRSVDYMGPNFERKLALAPKSHEDAALAVFGPGFFGHMIEQGCWFNLSSVVLLSAAARERMREDLRVAEDYEFWVRLARSHGYACLKQEQIEYVLGDDNISFETEQQVDGHSPQLLRAYRHMLAYAGLASRERALLRGRIAEELFNWAWRARTRGMRWQAARLHARSFAHGHRRANLLGLLKCLV